MSALDKIDRLKNHNQRILNTSDDDRPRIRIVNKRLFNGDFEIPSRKKRAQVNETDLLGFASSSKDKETENSAPFHAAETFFTQEELIEGTDFLAKGLNPPKENQNTAISAVPVEITSADARRVPGKTIATRNILKDISGAQSHDPVPTGDSEPSFLVPASTYLALADAVSKNTAQNAEIIKWMKTCYQELTLLRKERIQAAEKIASVPIIDSSWTQTYGFPLNTVLGYKECSSLLERDKSKLESLIQAVESNISGSTINILTTRALKFLLRDEVLQTLVLTKPKKSIIQQNLVKTKFKGTSLYKTIKAAVERKSRASGINNFSEDVVDKAITAHLSGAFFRLNATNGSSETGGVEKTGAIAEKAATETAGPGEILSLEGICESPQVTEEERQVIDVTQYDGVFSQQSFGSAEEDDCEETDPSFSPTNSNEF
ncbi:uncharacterized protein LOC135936395 isoform X2 [Cloeon dipterum]